MDKTALILIVFFLLLAFVVTFFVTGGAEAAVSCQLEWISPNCDDGDLMNGYWWRGGWVPGLIKIEDHFKPTPRYSRGMATYYTPGTMEATADYMGLSLDGYVDGIAMMSCADIGSVAWIRRIDPIWWVPVPWWEWEGPYLVVDCAEWDDHYPITVHRGELTELGFKTAERWGLAERNWRGVINHEYIVPVEVWLEDYKPPEWIRGPTHYVWWFIETTSFIPEWQLWLPYKPVFFSNPVRWYLGDDVGFISYLDNRSTKPYDESWWFRYYREHLYKP